MKHSIYVIQVDSFLSLSLFCSPKINDMHTSGPKQQRMNKNWKWSRRRNKPQIILLPSNKLRA